MEPSGLGTAGGGVSAYDENSLVSYARADGLAWDEVWAGAAGPDGSVWFAASVLSTSRRSDTPGGVSRFDGVNFVTYRQADGLADNRPWALRFGPDGKLGSPLAAEAFRSFRMINSRP